MFNTEVLQNDWNDHLEVQLTNHYMFFFFPTQLRGFQLYQINIVINPVRGFIMAYQKQHVQVFTAKWNAVWQRPMSSCIRTVSLIFFDGTLKKQLYRHTNREFRSRLLFLDLVAMSRLVKL